MAKKQPDDLAKFLGHAAVGLGVAYAAHHVLKKAEPAIFLALVGIIAHAAFDAPVAQVLSELGL